jgi:hypothetical protein
MNCSSFSILVGRVQGRAMPHTAQPSALLILIGVVTVAVVAVAVVVVGVLLRRRSVDSPSVR